MMRLILISVSLSLVLPTEALSAAAQDGADRSSAKQMDRLLQCRALPEATARLACFDREAATVADRVAKRDLVVVDREAVRSTKRTLFGLSIPKLGLFDDDKESEVTELTGVIESVGRNSDGGFVFFLQGGARWSQIDSRPIALEPEKGDKVVIRRAALGSYMLSVNRQPGVRVRRTA